MEIDEYQDPGNLAGAKKAWEDLFANRAWLSLVGAVQAQVDQFQNAVLFGEVTDTASLYRMERQKGQLEGRLSLASTAQAMYEGVVADLEMAKERKENGNGAA